jgi:hypothetical protein
MTVSKFLHTGLVFLAAPIMALGDPVPPDAGKAEAPPFNVTETEIQLPGVTIERKTLEVRIDATVCLDAGILEFVVCKPNTFEHESIFTTEAKPELVHAALLLAGMKPTPLLPGMEQLWWGKALGNQDSRVKIEIEWEESGEKKRESLTSMLRSREGDEAKAGAEAKDGWVFAGSFMLPGQDGGERVYAGNISGILVGIWPDPSTVIQYGITSGNPYEGERKGLEINEKRVPKLGTKVKLVFSRHFPREAKEPAEKGEPRESDVDQ